MIGIRRVRASISVVSQNADLILILVAILLTALNLRLAIGSVLPLLETIRSDLGLGRAAISLLISIPTLSMGIFAFSADSLSYRFGRKKTIVWALLLVGGATLARLWGDIGVVLFLSTIVVGIGIAVSQTLLPATVSAYFDGREAMVTGFYTACLIGGAGIAASFTVDLTGLLGTWTAALAVWGLLIIPPCLIWLVVLRNDAIQAEEVEKPRPNSIPWRNPFSWLLAAYYGGAAILFFASLTWLAPRYEDLGWSISQTGDLVTLLIVSQLVGALGIASLADYTRDRRPWYFLTLGGIAIGLVGVAYLPAYQPLLWTILIGLGDGGIFSLVLTLPIDYSVDADAAGKLSSIVLGGGYIIGATGPVVVGWVRDWLGSYQSPLLMLIWLCVIMSIVALKFRPDAQA